jgi:hypothetical protein
MAGVEGGGAFGRFQVIGAAVVLTGDLFGVEVVEPDGDISVKVLKERLCAHFQTTLEKTTLKLSA